MDKVLLLLAQELDGLKKSGKNNSTGEVRKVSKRIHKGLAPYSFAEKLVFCDTLLADQEWTKWIIAFDIAFKEREHYTLETFGVFEIWLKKYVNSWEDCDDFCVHPLGALILDYPQLYEKVLGWCGDENYVVRRAAAVSLIYSVRKSKFDKKKVFMVADALMADEHYLVQKGVGWLLKEFSCYEGQAVEDYLRKHVEKMSRLSFRYALEKLDKNIKKALMSL